MNNIPQYVPFQLSFFLVLGVLFGFHFSIPIQTIFLIGLLNLLFLGFSYYINKTNHHWRIVFQLLSYSLLFTIGITTLLLHKPINIKNHYSHYISDNQAVIFQIENHLKPSVYHTKYFVNILQIDSVKTKGKVLLNVVKDSTINRLEIGETYLTYTNFSEVNKPKNPFSFDYNAYLKKNSVYHQITTQKKKLKQLASKGYSLQIISGKIRRKIQKSLLRYRFTKDELGIINALVLGQRQGVSRELLSNYASAGAIHILAVSGLHVGVLFMFLSFLLKPIEKIKHGKHFNTIFIILFLWGFALLTGLSGSVVRAVTMFTFIAIGMSVTNSRSSVLHALITSFFLLVLIHPLYIFDVGFQMSYAAVLGIVLFFPKIESLLPRIKWALPRKIWQLLVVSLSATIGTLPISLFYFHQFPGLFFLSNIVIVPFVGVIMGIGISVTLLSFFNVLPNILVDGYSILLSSMNHFIGWIALQEQFLFQHIPFSISALLSSYLVIALGYSFWNIKQSKNLIAFLMAILVFQSVFFWEKIQKETSEELIIFHKSRHTLIGIKKNKELKIAHTLDSISIQKNNSITNYKMGKHLNNTLYTKEIPAIIDCNKTKILIIDSLGVYQNLSFKPNIVFLRQSPKINLKRLINLYQPKLVLADGSNYKSAISNWRTTCSLNHINFYYTGTKGAYILKK